MKTKVKTFFVVVGVLAVVTAISLTLISRGPLYGQAEDDNWIPNLIGTWTGEVVGYFYEDVTDPTCEPLYIEGFLNDFFITHQDGRAFTGTWYEGPDKIKIAGVMLPDRTVSIQDFTPSEERNFFTGRMTKSGGTLQISGYLHSFDDFNHRHWPFKEGGKTMASAYVQLVKVD